MLALTPAIRRSLGYRHRSTVDRTLASRRPASICRCAISSTTTEGTWRLRDNRRSARSLVRRPCSTTTVGCRTPFLLTELAGVGVGSGTVRSLSAFAGWLTRILAARCRRSDALPADDRMPRWAPGVVAAQNSSAERHHRTTALRATDPRHIGIFVARPQLAAGSPGAVGSAGQWESMRRAVATFRLVAAPARVEDAGCG
jgi:hypothetical protein